MKNPFDITSKYTFMGTLLTQMMGFLSTNSLMSAVASSESVISSSIVAMGPTASAYNIEKTLPESIEKYAETCPYLASIGAIGDAYCNPYSITDLSTIEIDPLDVINILNDTANGEMNSNFLDEDAEDGNVIIDASSDLAKYILYCDNRNSAFGIADQNIVNAVSDWGQVKGEFSNEVNSAIGAVPIVGDIIDVVDNEQALANAGYVSGESCVAGNDVNFSESPNWEKAKYYQRFIEDQSLAETMGLFGENGKSAVTAFLDDYYEENPLDNSYEGILARYSGLDKEMVVALLDLIDYGNYIANYDASERYAFASPMIETQETLNFDNENIAGNYYILLDKISFSDVRNRSFAV